MTHHGQLQCGFGATHGATCAAAAGRSSSWAFDTVAIVRLVRRNAIIMSPKGFREQQYLHRIVMSTTI